MRRMVREGSAVLTGDLKEKGWGGEKNSSLDEGEKKSMRGGGGGGVSRRYAQRGEL